MNSLLQAPSVIALRQLPKETAVNTRREGTFASLAAVLVLFSAMWDPRISVAVSVIALATIGIYSFVKKFN